MIIFKLFQITSSILLQISLFIQMYQQNRKISIQNRYIWRYLSLISIQLKRSQIGRKILKYYWIKITLKEKNKFENPTLCVCIVNAWDLTLPVLLCLFEQYLDNVKATVHEHLRNLINSPSVQMQDIPPDLLSLENTEEHDPDIRNHQDQTDKRSVRIELHVFYNEISGFSTQHTQNFFNIC